RLNNILLRTRRSKSARNGNMAHGNTSKDIEIVMGNSVAERVLVFGDDMRIFLAVVRSLGRAGKEVHAAPLNWHSPALKSKYISAVHHFPCYADDPAAWRASVLSVLRAFSFQLIVPCTDPTILAFDAHREEF